MCIPTRYVYRVTSSVQIIICVLQIYLMWFARDSAYVSLFSKELCIINEKFFKLLLLLLSITSTILTITPRQQQQSVVMTLFTIITVISLWLELCNTYISSLLLININKTMLPAVYYRSLCVWESHTNKSVVCCKVFLFFHKCV